jgi:hypothetical protein
MLFLKIAIYQGTPKSLYVLKGLKGRTTENWRENRHPPPSLILSNSFLIKIDPCGIKFAMMMPRPHGFGNVVAQGHNLCMWLQSQNCEFAASGGENMSQS